MNTKRITGSIVLGMTISASVMFAADGTPNSPNSPISTPPPREFSPMTRYERFNHYASGLVSLDSVFSAVAAGAIAQARGTPKEWGGGAEPYGWRTGSRFAQHIVRNTLQYGIAAALHEDNRYFVSQKSGFLARTKYAVMSTLLARHDNGSRGISFSRIGGAAGAAFISRAWQPPSTTTAGDGAVSFGLTIGTQMGFNVVREFWPDVKRHFHRR